MTLYILYYNYFEFNQYFFIYSTKKYIGVSDKVTRHCKNKLFDLLLYTKIYLSYNAINHLLQ